MDIYGIKTDLSEKIVKIIEQGKTKYGSRAWSAQIAKLFDDKNCKNLRSEGFPKELIDQEAKNVGREL